LWKRKYGKMGGNAPEELRSREKSDARGEKKKRKKNAKTLRKTSQRTSKPKTGPSEKKKKIAIWLGKKKDPDQLNLRG